MGRLFRGLTGVSGAVLSATSGYENLSRYLETRTSITERYMELFMYSPNPSYITMATDAINQISTTPLIIGTGVIMAGMITGFLGAQDLETIREN